MLIKYRKYIIKKNYNTQPNSNTKIMVIFIRKKQDTPLFEDPIIKLHDGTTGNTPLAVKFDLSKSLEYFQIFVGFRGGKTSFENITCPIHSFLTVY